MKKFLMLLVAGTLVLSIAGCKKKEEPKKPADTKTEKPADKPADDAKK